MIKENFQKIIKVIENLSDDEFDMSSYTRDKAFQTQNVSKLQKQEFRCNSVGCIIGHSIHLDVPLMNKLINERPASSMIWHYANWAVEFLGLNFVNEIWIFCFSAKWAEIDNTREGAISRLQAIIDNKMKNHKDYSVFCNRILKIS